MNTKKAILVRIILRRGSFFRFLKRLKESRSMKKKDKIFILSKFLLPLGAIPSMSLVAYVRRVPTEERVKIDE